MQPGAPALTWADTVDLDNLVPYTHPSAGWSDRHSYLVLTWTNPQASGRAGHPGNGEAFIEAVVVPVTISTTTFPVLYAVIPSLVGLKLHFE